MLRLQRVAPFVMVPQAAIRLALTGPPGRLAAVLWLYEQADRSSWDAFGVTCRALADASGLTRYAASTLLAELEAAGLALVERSCTRAPSRVALARPGRKSASDEDAGVFDECAECAVVGQPVSQKSATARGVDTRAGSDPQTQTLPGSTDQPTPGGSGGLVAPAAAAPPVLAEDREEERSVRRQAERDAVAEVHRAWLAEEKPDGSRWHRGAILVDGDRDRALRCLTQLAKELRRAGAPPLASVAAARDRLIGIVAVYHRAPATAYWRGENANGAKHLAFGLLMDPRRLGDRLSKLAEWEEAGRPEATVAPKARPTGPSPLADEARRAWAWLRGRIPEWGPYGVPSPLHPDPDKARATQAAIDAVGGLGRLSGSTFEVERLAGAWQAAYVAARGES